MVSLPAIFSRHLLALLRMAFFASIAWASPTQAAPDFMAQPTLLPRGNPLCDSNLVDCLDIDDFAAHAYAHLMVLPRTDQRDSAVIVPYGVSIGMFGRVAGGIATDFGFWQVDRSDRHRNGPLRLDFTALLWPLLPFRQSPAVSPEDGLTHSQPVHHLRLGIHYEHQLRIGPFDGPNSLGLMTDMAAARFVATRAIGPMELTASLGALYDWHGVFATGEAALQLGLYLPFFRAMKIYGEVLGRGAPVYLRRRGDERALDLAVLSADGADPIQRQSVVGAGLSFRPNARVDFAVSVQMGLGGLAPAAVLVRVLTLSAGTGYRGRAATPVAQLAADATADIAEAIKEYVASLPIDPKLDEQCVIHDDDGSIMGTFGKLSKNRYYCEENGFRVPVNFMLLRDKAKSMLCREHSNRQLRDCLLERRGSKWIAVHRPSLDAKCEMYDSDGTYLGRLGTPTQDGARCRYAAERDNGGYSKVVQYQEQPIGEAFHTDADRSRVCLDRAMQRCIMKAAVGRNTLSVEGSERFTKNYVQHFEQEGESAAQKLKDVAAGKVSLTTVGHEVTKAVEAAIKKAQNPRKAGLEVAAAFQQAIVDWKQKSPEQQQDSLARVSAGATISVAGSLLTGGTAGLLKSGTEALEVAAKLETVGEDIGKIALSTERAEKVLAKAERKIAKHAPTPEQPRAKPPHRNFADDRPATLYRKDVMVNGELVPEKYGVTHHSDPSKRYTRNQIGDGKVKFLERGPRKEMLKRERRLVETEAGAANREPWAGCDSCE